MDIDRRNRSAAERCYRALLRLYPRSFREEAEPELVAAFRDGWSAARQRGGWAALGFARLVLADLLRSVPLEWSPPWRTPPAGHLWVLPSTNLRSSSMDRLWQDVRYAIRSLRAAPLAAGVAAVTIAIGVGATTTILSVANALLLRAPPGVVTPSELVTLHQVSPDGSSFHSFSYRGYETLRNAGGGLRDVAAWDMVPTSLTTGDDEPRLLAGMAVSANYFDLLGARPALGRLLVAEDESGPSGMHVVVLSHTTWQRRFAGDPGILGRTVTLNGQPFVVVGVAEPGFLGHVVAIDVATWIPIGASLPAERVGDLQNPRSSWLELVGRLEAGQRPDAVAGVLTPLLNRFMEESGFEGERGVDVRPYAPVPAPALLPVAGFLGMLLVLAGLILMIASANVANMLLARSASRAREIAVRLAVGASRARLIRQLMTESLVLFTMGGLGGVALASWLTSLLAAVSLPIPVPVALDFALDVRVLVVALFITLGTGLVFGLAPALQSTRPDLTRSLKDEAGVIRMGRYRLRGAFVVAQVAGTTLLLVVTGLFIRSLERAGAVNLGFDLADLHVVSPELAAQQYDAVQTLALAEEFERRVATLPGVTTIGAIDVLPVNLGNQTTVLAIPGREPVEGVGWFGTDFAAVTPGFLPAMHIPLLRGRGFLPADRQGAPGVAIINATLAERVWPGENPIGKDLLFGSFVDGTPLEVIGVARDAKYRGLADQGVGMVYVPMAQSTRRSVHFVVRTTPGGAAPAPALRAIVRELDPNLPVEVNAPYRQVVGVALFPNRIATFVAGVFGATGLLLAIVGLYGVLAFTVQRRRREIGVRMALGAGRDSIRGLVVRQGMGVAGLGLVLGMLAAAAVTRLLGGLLYGLHPLDPVTYGAIALVMMLTAILACLDPVRRALQTQPLEVLRHD